MARKYSNEELAFIQEAYTRLSIAEVTLAFNAIYSPAVSEGQVRGVTRNHKFRSGRTGRFEKGMRPWTAGKKGIHSGSTTSFKKGHRPHTWVPVGTERLTTGDEYIKVKIAEPNIWKFKHILMWETHNGPVPKGFCVVFKDGDRCNCNLDNLQLIDRGVLAQYNKNRGGSYPPELRTTVRAVAELKVTASRRIVRPQRMFYELCN